MKKYWKHEHKILKSVLKLVWYLALRLRDTNFLSTLNTAASYMKSGWSYVLAMALRGAGNRELRQISSMNAGAPTVLYKISKFS